MISLLGYLLDQKSDDRLKHELNHILAVISIENHQISIKDSLEFNEYDLKEVSNDPFFLQIISQNGDVIFTSENVPKFEKIPSDFVLPIDKYVFTNLATKGHSLRAVYYKMPDKVTGDPYVIQLSIIDRAYPKVIEQLILVNLFSFPFVIILILLISYFIVQKSFNPISAIIDTAEKITAKNLNERIKIKVDDPELQKLKDTLNTLFERLEKYVNSISQFTDNASHQLMTPLTAIQSELEFILKKERRSEDYKETLQLLKEQSLKMINIVKSLLILARETDLSRFNNSIFNLSKLIETEIIPIYNQYDNMTFDYDKEIYCRGNSDYVSIIIYNLLDNAIKYSNPNSPVELTALIENSNIIIKVKDRGIGISEEEQEKIFERFYRSEKTEQAGIQGFGLGLSLVGVLIKSLKGKIEIISEPGKGTEIIIRLPAIEME